MFESQTGLRWFNNGIRNTKARVCPDGFKLGYLRKTTN